jgi:hypothetical protein
MAGTWTTLTIKDAAGTTQTMRVWDESGVGSGPYSFGGMISNGAGGNALPGLGSGNGLKVDGSGVALPISAASLPLPTGAATSALQGGGLPAALDGSGFLKVHEQGTATVDTELAAAAALADGASNPTTATAGAAMLGYNGATWDRVRVANISKYLEAVTITTITTVWTPTSGKKFRIMGGTISVSAACYVIFEDNSHSSTTNYIHVTPKLTADTPYNFVVLGGQGFLSAAANNVLKATSSAAAAITGTIWGVEE